MNEVRDSIVGVGAFFFVTALLGWFWYVFIKPKADKIISPKNQKRIIELILFVVVGGYVWYIIRKIG